MIKKIIIFIFTFLGGYSNAQELACKVTVNSQKIAQSNKKTFIALEKSIQDFMNNTEFTSDNYKKNQKVDCNFILQLNSYENNIVNCTIIVGSRRLIFGTNYQSPILNFREENVTFSYLESEPINYSSNSYTSELSAILSFYAHVFIGLDQDTFELMGGTNNLNIAMNVVNFAQSNGGEAWQQGKKLNNKYYLINDILSSKYSPYRKALYKYHLNGLDILETKPKIAKDNIKKSIFLLKKNFETKPLNFPNRLFFDAKANEIQSIYSAGVEYEKDDLVELLNIINSSNSNKWYRM